MITRAADECMPALKPTTIEMQLNTQRFIQNEMLTKKEQSVC